MSVHTYGNGALTIPKVTVGNPKPSHKNVGSAEMRMEDPPTSPGVKDGTYRVTILDPGEFKVEDPSGVIVGTGNVSDIFTGEINFRLLNPSPLGLVTDDVFTVQVTVRWDRGTIAGAFLDAVALPADTIQAGGSVGVIKSIESAEDFTLEIPWTGGNILNEPYVLIKNSPDRYDTSRVSPKVENFIDLLAENIPARVHIVTGSAPAGGLGEIGHWAVKINNSTPWQAWQKTGAATWADRGFAAVMRRHAFGQSQAWMTLNRVIPYDNTVPTSTEGIEVCNASIDIPAATDHVEVQFSASVSAEISDPDKLAGAVTLFLQGQASALHVETFSLRERNKMGGVSFFFKHKPAVTGLQRYSVRMGPAAVGQRLYLNGISTGKKFGGASRAILTLSVLGSA